MLSVDDIENASDISSIPKSFSAVTTHLKQQNKIVNKQLTDSIRASVINSKNRTNSQGMSSTANAVKASTSNSSSTNTKSSNETQKLLPQCEH